MKRLAIVIGLLVASAQAQGAEFAIMGFGVSTCAQFANQYKVNPTWTELNYFTWAQGYLSGWNSAQLAAKGPYLDLSSLSTEAQQAYLRNYCDQHPLGDFLDAVLNLGTQFKKKTVLEDTAGPGQ